MGADGRIAGIDPYSTTWVRAADQHDHARTVMVVSTLDQTSHAIVGLDERGARLFLQQVLEAAGVDLVGAARKVVDAVEEDEAYSTGETQKRFRAAFRAAFRELSAELAKLKGGA